MSSRWSRRQRFASDTASNDNSQPFFLTLILSRLPQGQTNSVFIVGALVGEVGVFIVAISPSFGIHSANAFSLLVNNS
jgi:hypothetical protein